MGRRTRAIPSGKPVFELMPRDLLILEAVGRCGYLTAEQIGRQFFPSADRCRHRLRQLLDGRVIAVTLQGSRQPNLVSLSRQGLETLQQRLGDVTGIRLAGPIRASAVPHHVLTCDVRLYLAAFGSPEAAHGQLIAWSGGRSSRATELGIARFGIIPDAIADLRLGSSEGTALIEIDCGTEGVALETKLQRYSRFLDGKQKTELWLACVADEARLRSVVQMCVRADVITKTRLFLPSDLVVRPAAAPVPKLLRILQNEVL